MHSLSPTQPCVRFSSESAESFIRQGLRRQLRLVTEGSVGRSAERTTEATTTTVSRTLGRGRMSNQCSVRQAAGGSRKLKPNMKPQLPNAKPRYTFEDMLDQPCKLHSTPGRPSAHTTRQCDFVKRIAKGDALPPPPQNRGPPQGQNHFPRQDTAYMIFTSESTDKGSRRARAQEVNATMPAIPQYMQWSDCSISWSRKDHPSIMPNPGTYPLVVDTLVVGPRFSCKFSRVLIDGGSTINILYRDTLVKLGLTERDLECSRTIFHGIVPGLSCTPMGRIRLDVIFGTE